MMDKYKSVIMEEFLGIILPKILSDYLMEHGYHKYTLHDLKKVQPG